MSRYLSLCSQRRACGRLAKNTQWLEGGCTDDRAYGGDEVKLGMVFGKAEGLGRSTCDFLDVLGGCCMNVDSTMHHTKVIDAELQAFIVAASLLSRDKTESRFLAYSHNCLEVSPSGPCWVCALHAISKVNNRLFGEIPTSQGILSDLNERNQKMTQKTLCTCIECSDAVDRIISTITIELLE